jgi:hypothetical protein
VYKS